MVIMIMIQAYVARNHYSVLLQESYFFFNIYITLSSVVDRNTRFEITCH